MYENFNINACLVYGQVRKGEGNFFSTVGKPRRINGFYYFYDGDGEYTLKSGEKKYAKKGDVVFLPPFCEYNSLFYSHGKKKVDGILINLLFSDKDGKEFYLSNDLEIFTPKDGECASGKLRRRTGQNRKYNCRLRKVKSRREKSLDA